MEWPLSKLYSQSTSPPSFTLHRLFTDLVSFSIHLATKFMPSSSRRMVPFVLWLLQPFQPLVGAQEHRTTLGSFSTCLQPPKHVLRPWGTGLLNSCCEFRELSFFVDGMRHTCVRRIYDAVLHRQTTTRRGMESPHKATTPL